MALPVDLDRLRHHGERFVSGFTSGQKVVTVLGLVAMLFGALFVTRWSATEDYAPLYTGLESVDAAEVTQELDARGTSYRLEDGGRTILVARSNVYKTRLDLSAKGLPNSGGDSFAILDQRGITTNEFIQRVDYQRALQGELEKTIRALDAVRTANVTLTLPKDQIFKTEKEALSAAVLIETRGGKSLSSQQVQTIVNLVASSVADLDPGQVTVSDSNGKLYAAPGKELSVAGGEGQEQTAAFEAELSRKIEDLVTAALGPGAVKAAVTVALNFDQSTQTRRTFTQPNNIEVPLRQKTDTETYTGDGAATGGVLGPDGTPVDGGTGTVEYERDQSEAEYALNSVEQIINQAPGGIEQLAVAVLLDEDAVAAADVAAWTNAIGAAVGIDQNRNDTLVVQRTPFDDTVAKAAEKELSARASAESRDFLMMLVRYVVTLLIVALVLFFSWRSLKRSQAFGPVRVPLDMRELEAAGERHAGPALELASAAANALPEPAVSPFDQPASEVETQITELIERQPDEVALTLRSWLADRRS